MNTIVNNKIDTHNYCSGGITSNKSNFMTSLKQVTMQEHYIIKISIKFLESFGYLTFTYIHQQSINKSYFTNSIALKIFALLFRFTRVT